MKKILYSLIALAIIIPGYSQENKDKDKDKDTKTSEVYTVFKEKILEDFETTVYTDKNITFQRSSYQEAKLAIRSKSSKNTPAPTGNSKKYLGVKAKARYGDVFIIKPAKDLIIEQYCKTISIWVYGKRFSGQLSILLQDAKKRNHRIILGKLNFLGWKKLNVNIGRRITQQDDFLNQNKNMKILQIQYRPANRTRLAYWHFFYIDDISAVVRNKYKDDQDDEW